MPATASACRRNAPRGGSPVLGHSGDTPGGFRSENAWFPAESLSVTVLYNSGDTRGASPILPLIARIALGRPLPGAPAAAEPASATHR